jgi:hypothetical protein
MQKIIKPFVSWLSGPHGTSNYDHQFLIYSDLNYTNVEADLKSQTQAKRLPQHEKVPHIPTVVTYETIIFSNPRTFRGLLFHKPKIGRNIFFETLPLNGF